MGTATGDRRFRWANGQTTGSATDRSLPTGVPGAVRTRTPTRPSASPRTSIRAGSTRSASTPAPARARPVRAGRSGPGRSGRGRPGPGRSGPGRSGRGRPGPGRSGRSGPAAGAPARRMAAAAAGQLGWRAAGLRLWRGRLRLWRGRPQPRRRPRGAGPLHGATRRPRRDALRRRTALAATTADRGGPRRHRRAAAGRRRRHVLLPELQADQGQHPGRLLRQARALGRGPTG